MLDKQGRSSLIAAVRMKLIVKYSKIDRNALVVANYKTGRVEVSIGAHVVYRCQIVWLNTRGGILPKFDTWLRINKFVIVEGSEAEYYRTRVHNTRCGSFSGFVRTLSA